MEYPRALVGGVLGGALALTLFAAARLAGVPVHLVLALGEVLGVPAGTRPWFAGFGEALIITGLFGVLYVAVLHAMGIRADWRSGTVLGAVHASITGILLGVLPPVAGLAAPGFFMVNVGAAAVIVTIGGHLLYGAVVGALCSQVSRAIERPATTTRTAAPRPSSAR
jgi:hypothetical protein